MRFVYLFLLLLFCYSCERNKAVHFAYKYKVGELNSNNFILVDSSTNLNWYLLSNKGNENVYLLEEMEADYLTYRITYSMPPFYNTNVIGGGDQNKKLILAIEKQYEGDYYLNYGESNEFKFTNKSSKTSKLDFSNKIDTQGNMGLFASSDIELNEPIFFKVKINDDLNITSIVMRLRMENETANYLNLVKICPGKNNECTIGMIPRNESFEVIVSAILFYDESKSSIKEYFIGESFLIEIPVQGPR